jgi:hypothetical protein
MALVKFHTPTMIAKVAKLPSERTHPSTICDMNEALRPAIRAPEAYADPFIAELRIDMCVPSHGGSYVLYQHVVRAIVFIWMSLTIRFA